MLNKTQFGVSVVFGHKQRTYKQWPMYFSTVMPRREAIKA